MLNEGIVLLGGLTKCPAKPGTPASAYINVTGFLYEIRIKLAGERIQTSIHGKSELLLMA